MTWQQYVLAGVAAVVVVLYFRHWNRRDWRLRPHHRVIYHQGTWWLRLGGRRGDLAAALDRARRLDIEETS